MALEQFDIDLSPVDLPDPVARFLEDAESRIDHFFDTEHNKRLPRFIPSDSKLLYAALRQVTDNGLTLGETFCEWGSGFGVGVCLASLLGYKAYGIEIEPDLVEISTSLAADHGIPIEILLSDYVPEGLDSYEGMGGEALFEPMEFKERGAAEATDLVYEGMDELIEEIDLFYVYPKPDQQQFMLNLFESVAGEGAVLLAYYENSEICGYRRVHEA